MLLCLHRTGKIVAPAHVIVRNKANRSWLVCSVPARASVETQHFASPPCPDKARLRQAKAVLCETKPTEAAGGVRSVPARARPEPVEGASKETPCGVTTNGADRAKQSQSARTKSTRSHLQERGYARLVDAAKQSQFALLDWSVGTAHPTKRRNKANRCDRTPGRCRAKQSQRRQAGAVCSVPARASKENALRRHYERG
jgi:hypothetical protein